MKFVAKTLYGLEKVLEKELHALGAASISTGNRAVLFEGDKNLLYSANYCLRTALSILVPIASFRIKSKDDLYREGLRIEWERYLSPENTFSVVPVVNSPVFSHSGYPGLILKDSIADHFRNNTGRRPSVSAHDSDLVINLHISNNSVSVALDSTVVPLFKRGYRKEQSEAPLNEVLAAGILLHAGWDGSENFLDPMCGSGTFPIEAALIAGKIPPGKFRKFFGFMRWMDYDPVMFENIRSGYDRSALKPEIRISGSDISPEAVRKSEINVSEAGLTGQISLHVADIKDQKGSGDEVLFINPPYGLRLQPGETDQLYSTIGTVLKHNFSGCNAWLVSPNKEAIKHVGLKPAQKLILFNGALECSLLKYELYKGSRKPQADSQKTL
jgi:putative N6-adenine-specific DNA methylase